jgi:hypothetical protein
MAALPLPNATPPENPLTGVHICTSCAAAPINHKSAATSISTRGCSTLTASNRPSAPVAECTCAMAPEPSGSADTSVSKPPGPKAASI